MSLFTLLSLPRTSSGLTELKQADKILDGLNYTGSAFPRKVPRLNTYSDSASASRSNRSGPKTITLRGSIREKEVKADKELALLRHSIRVILNPKEEEILPATNQTLYAACRTAVSLAGKGDGVYEMVKMELEKCVGVLTGTSRTRPTRGDMVEWLTSFVSTCKWFETRVNLLVSLLTYLDQEYIVQHNDLKPLRTMAYTIFQVRLLCDPLISECLEMGIEQWLKVERDTRAPHKQRSQIPLLVGHLVTHGRYTFFENHYIKVTRDYYTTESKRLYEELQKDPPVFFAHVQARIQEEEERSKDVLPVGSWGLVREVTEHALWTGRLEWLADETVGPYVVAKDFASLGAMYTLFGRVKGHKVLCSAFRKFIGTGVESIVQDTTQDETMVEHLLELKSLANEALQTAFLADSTAKPKASSNVPSSTSSVHKQPDQAFVYALGDAYTVGFKKRRNKPAEMIAKYLDRAMRRGQGSSSDAQFEKLLDDALGLYRYSDDKDVFRNFYHRGLAKRLLLGKSASDDFEASMLKKLKEKYDPEFGMGEDMFKDLALSRESMRDYHSKLDAEDPGRKLNVIVLQRSAWPFSKNDQTVDMPPNMQEQLTKFTRYYKHKHSGHALNWDHALGTATLKARFEKGVKELSVSLYQAIVLLLFNDSEQIPFSDIKEQTRLDDAELRRTLQSLACGKKKVLKKIPAGRDVNDEDVFRFNDDFEDPRAKIHINSIQAKVSPEESKRTNDAIEGDRKHYLDAAIVRIMKANKTMNYEKLKAATIDAVKNHFVPQVDVIKQRIGSLVESEYLKRHETDRNMFSYIA